MRSATAFLSKDKYSYVEFEIKGGSVRSPSYSAFSQLFARTEKKNISASAASFPLRTNSRQRGIHEAHTAQRLDRGHRFPKLSRAISSHATEYNEMSVILRGLVKSITCQSVRVSRMQTSNSRLRVSRNVQGLGIGSFVRTEPAWKLLSFYDILKKQTCLLETPIS